MVYGIMYFSQRAAVGDPCVVFLAIYTCTVGAHTNFLPVPKKPFRPERGFYTHPGLLCDPGTDIRLELTGLVLQLLLGG